MSKRGPKPKGIVDTVWRPELAYCVGLLASDGCLSGDGRHIDLTSADKEQIINFQKALGLNHVKIGRKGSGSTEGKKYYRIQFGDVLFYSWLQSIGLSPNKSKTMGALLIPDEFFFDFFRGLFDGDGSMYGFWDTRWKRSYTYWLMITSASPAFVVWLRTTCERLVGQSGFVHQGPRAQELRFAKTATRELVKHMYADTNAPRLKRKFAKLRRIINIDDTK